MICHRCNQTIEDGQLYHRPLRRGTDDADPNFAALTGSATVHDTCPPVEAATTVLTDNIEESEIRDGNGKLIRTRRHVTNRDQVRAIRQAWRELMPEKPPTTYGFGPAVDLDILAQVAINVIADWHKRDQ